VELLIDDYLAAGAFETSAGFFVIVSKRAKESIDLLLVEHVEPRKTMQTYLRDQLLRAKNLTPIDARALRENLSPEWAPFLSKYLHELHRIHAQDDDVITSTVWRYKNLVSWGEASAARELSLEMKVSVHTIHSRLRIARERGMLSSPGPGSRLG
jgi:hypothetical protein